MQLLTDLWQTGDTRRIAEGVLAADFIWEENLNLVPRLTDLLAADLQAIQEQGMMNTVISTLDI